MRRLLAVMIGAVSIATALSGAGLAAASARPAASGTEHFQLMTTSPTSNKESSIGTGLFTAGGVDISGTSTDTVKFPGGTFKIRHSPGTGPQTFNPRTCLLTVRQHGTYRVFGGTGKYARISGHGKYHLSILGIGAKVHGRCSQSRPPVSFQLVINASGPVSLP